MKKILLLLPLLFLSGCTEISHWAKTEPYIFDPSDPDYYVVPNGQIIVVVPTGETIGVEQKGETTVISAPR